MVRAEAVCDTLAKPMSDIEKQSLRRVFHRSFGLHPRAINYQLSQEEPLKRRQTILKLGIDPNEILSVAEVWTGIYKPLEEELVEENMNLEALRTDKCQSPHIDCRNRPKDVCDRGLCRRCCIDYGRSVGTDCYGHMLFFTEGDFSDSEQDNPVNKRREMGGVPKINFPYFRPRVILYGAANLEEAIKSKCKYQRVDFDPSFDLTDDHLIKLVSRFSTELRHLNLGSKETRAGLSLTPESLRELAKCRNLHKLSLECCVNMDDKTLDEILSGCPKLKYLESPTPFYSQYLSKKPYHERCEIKNQTGSKEHLIYVDRVILYGAANLEEAIKSKCKYQRVDFDPSFDLTDDHLIKLVSRFSTELRHLNLGSKETRAGLSLTPESLRELAKCRNLHKLSLECCVNMDDKTLDEILSGCPKLKYLEVISYQGALN
eukprot:sb/3464895/